MTRLTRIIVWAVSIVLVSSFAFGDDLPNPLDTQYHRIEGEGGIAAHIRAIQWAMGVAVCGYIPQGMGSSDPKRPINLHDVTAREALDWLVQEWPAFTWFEGPGNIVVVMPADLVDDPDFFLNQPMPATRYKGKGRSVALSFMQHIPREQDELVHSVGSGLISPYRRYVYGMELSVNAEEGTLLEHMNVVYSALGDHISWQIEGTHFLPLVTDLFPRVVTTDMARAQAYLESENVNLAEAVRLYEQALNTAPYSALRNQMLLELALLHVQHEPYGKESLVEAESFYETVLASAQKPWPNQRTAALNGLALIEDHQGDSAFAIELYWDVFSNTKDSQRKFLRPVK